MDPKSMLRRLAVPDGREVRLAGLADVEVRVAEDDKPIGFKGTASVFNSPTKIGGRWGFWEQIDPAAFDSAFERGDDARMLKNHNTDLPLARVSAGSLRLSSSKNGLDVDADMDPVSYARDLAVSLERKTVTQMSFGFTVSADKWEILEADQPWGGKEGDELRTVLDLSLLWEVSPVTFPAYADTDAGLRNLDLLAVRDALGLEDDDLHRLAAALRAGTPVDPDLATVAATRLLAQVDGPAIGHRGTPAATPGMDPHAVRALAAALSR